MYSLSYFTENDPARVLEFMRAHPFVMLCGCDAEGRPVCTQVPVLFSNENDQIVLRGHFMRKTDHHVAFTANPNALVIFAGPHEYVSASWYSDPAQASTWNYISVHARGLLEFVPEDELVGILRDTTSFFENDPGSPASFDKLSSEYVSKLLKAIVGFRIKVDEMENVFKLSQNRDEKSYDTIVEKLEEKGGDGTAISREMRLRRNELFPVRTQAD